MRVLFRSAVLVLCGLSASSSGWSQSGDARAQMMSRALSCLDLCDASFQQCLGPVPPRGPPTPIPPPGNGEVPTQPPFEQCLLEHDVCVMQCQVDLARARKDAAGRATAARPPR